MKSLGLAVVALLLLAAASAGSWGAEGREAGGPWSVVPQRMRADQTADRPGVLLFRQRPDGGCAGIVTLGHEEGARGLAWRGGTDYKLRVIEPPQGVDCKIVCIPPDPHVDYKIHVLDPGGHDVSGAPLANRRKTIIIDPNRRGRRK